MKNLRMFRKVIGENNMCKCCLVTTKWSLEEQSVALKREKVLTENRNFWKLLLTRGARVERFGDSMTSAIEIIRPLAEGQAFLPRLTKETVIEKKLLVETEAGKEVNENLEEAQKLHKKEIAELNDQYKRALLDRETELADKIRTEREKYNE